MADTLKQFYIGQPTNSGTAGDLLYTAPSGSSGVATAVIRNIHVANTTGTAATFTLSIGGDVSSAARCIYKTFSVPGSGVHIANVSIVLTQGQSVYALQGTNVALTLVISGVEF